MEKEGKMTLQELIDYKYKYQGDLISKDEFREIIERYERDNNCRAPGYVYTTLNNLEKNREDKKFVKRGMTIFYIILILVVLGIIRFGIWLFSDNHSSQNYTTYYDDENDNGQLDKGEWNWTEDENGNKVDVDNDGSNF